MNPKTLNTARLNIAQTLRTGGGYCFGWHTHFKRIYLFTVFVGFISSTLSSAAYAECEIKPEWVQAVTTLPSIQIPEAIPDDSSTAVGTVIWSAPVPAPAPQVITNTNLDCRGTMAAIGMNNGAPGEPAEPNNTYRTNVKGIGYRIRNEFNEYFPITRTLNRLRWSWPDTPQMGGLQFELVKTGPIEYATEINGGMYGAIALQTASGKSLPVFGISVAAGGAVKKLPCTPDTKSLAVNLGRVSTTDLESPKQRHFRDFSIKLSCESDVNLQIQIRANSDQAPQGLINADANSQVQGAVVELMDGGNNPIPLNTYLEHGKTGTAVDLDFKARLKRKSAAAPITLGNFSASATLWLDYY